MSPSPIPGGADRLSLLPDELLHHILSFLSNTSDTSEIARTSVLSRRFRHIWTHHPSICLGRSIISPSSDQISIYRRSVKSCIGSHNLSFLQSLYLHLVSSRSAHRWLHRVSTSSPSLSSLSLIADPCAKVVLTRTIFTCSRLVSLNLSYLSFHSAPSNFPGYLSLANLKLEGCRVDDQTLTSFLSKCPSLRSLSISMCRHLISLHLSSANLTMLDIWYCPNLEQVKIDAPNMKSLKFSGNLNNLYMNDTPQLVDVDIHHSHYGSGTDISTFDEWIRPIMCISHARNRLRISGWFFKFVLPRAASKPMFRNIRKLHIRVDWITVPVLDGLASMLRHCLSMEKLNINLSGGSRESVMYYKQFCREYNLKDSEISGSVIEFERMFEEDESKEIWDASKHMEEDGDVAHKLKAITLNCFAGTQNEIKLLEYLLGKSIILKMIYIKDCMLRSREEIEQLLACIPRASSHVQICEF